MNDEGAIAACCSRPWRPRASNFPSAPSTFTASAICPSRTRAGRLRSRWAMSCRSRASGRGSSPLGARPGGPAGRAGRARSCRLLRGRYGHGLRRRRAQGSPELRVPAGAEGLSAPAGGRRAGRRSVRRCDSGGGRPRGRHRRRLAGTRALSRSGGAGRAGTLRAASPPAILRFCARCCANRRTPGTARWPHR